MINEVQGKVEQLGDKFTILGLLGSSSSTISLSFQATQDIHEINSVLLCPRDPLGICLYIPRKLDREIIKLMEALCIDMS